MISLVVPSRNRAHTLRLIGDSFFAQQDVSEIIFVLDACTDDSEAVIGALATRYPSIRTIVLSNEARRGAPYNRVKGFRAASNDFIAFSDDDVHLEPGYLATCLRKLQETGAAFVSGRRVTKTPYQTPEQAIAAFGDGTAGGPVFRKAICEIRHEARFTGDVRVPFTMPMGVTTKALLERFSFDSAYCRGNGYREESDYQMNAFVNGYDIVMTNDTHYVELSRWENRSGGHRISRFSQLYWSVYYTHYFFSKYYARYAARVGLRMNRHAALGLFTLRQVYALFVRPARHLHYLIPRLWRGEKAASNPAM